MNKPVFKPYQQDQPMLLPPRLEELIPAGHVVRVVNEIIDEIDLKPLIEQYKGGGTSAYHPKMMLKVVVYAYTQRTFSSRQIAKGLRENIHFMWLSGMNRPNHRTINRFRGEVMKPVIETVFYEVVDQLLDRGYITLETYFVDGTKIEANANRYSFVWRKNTERYKAGLQEKVRKLLDEIDELEAAEDERYGDADLEEVGEGKEIDAEAMKAAAKRINERLKDDPKNKTLKKAKRQLETDFIPREEKYEHQEETFQGRNSFSKTDEDATFMRMKEDHMRNGQLKPGYNIQAGTENQFIVGYSLHQRAGDTSCLKEHLEHFGQHFGEYPETITTDAGYGSEENYAFLEANHITAFVKYNSFHQEQKKNYKTKYPYRVDNWTYQEKDDQYICPQGRRLTYQKTRTHVTPNGYATTQRIYECEDCQGCPVRDRCTKSKHNRSVTINPELNRLRSTARDYLISPRGKAMRSRRPMEVEAVFGRLKQNWQFRRFLLRGLEKVSTEWGILCIAHNVAKMAVA